MKLVVCDDDPVIRYLLEVVLAKRAGHTVVVVGHPDAVAPAVVEHAPDLVVLDYVMPDRSGRDVVDELRADPATAAVPVVYLTGRSDLGDDADLAAIGVVGIVEKPFDTSTLASQLAEMLGRAKSA